jgi:hypothetical protein
MSSLTGAQAPQHVSRIIAILHAALDFSVERVAEELEQVPFTEMDTVLAAVARHVVQYQAMRDSVEEMDRPGASWNSLVEREQDAHPPQGEVGVTEQARRVVRSVEIVVEPQHGSTQIAYVNIQSQGGYVSAATVRSQPDLYEEALQSYRSRLEAAVAQLAKLEELAPRSQKSRIRKDRRTLERLVAA